MCWPSIGGGDSTSAAPLASRTGVVGTPPKATLPTKLELAAVRPALDVTDEMIDEELERIRMAGAEFRAIEAAVELSSRYIHDRKLPDKAIDVLDEAGAAQMLVPEAKRKKTITVKEVEDVVAKMARMPAKKIGRAHV